MAPKPLTLNGYALHRRAKRLPGGTIRSVVEAVAAGRIDVGPGQTIADPAAADQAWATRTDADKARGRHTNGHAHPKSLPEARRLESLERARGLKLANDKLAGRLVEAAAIERLYSGHVIEARNALLGVPSKLKMRCPHLTVSDLAVVDVLIRECLENLADRATPRPGIDPQEAAQ